MNVVMYSVCVSCRAYSLIHVYNTHTHIHAQVRGIMYNTHTHTQVRGLLGGAVTARNSVKQRLVLCEWWNNLEERKV